MIEQWPRVATISGFHGDGGAVNDVPITNCCTAINRPDLQEMLIVILSTASNTLQSMTPRAVRFYP
jgi:hypothetical protein